MRANSLLSLTSLHDAARKGDSYALQQLITVIDPTAAKKVAAVLLQRENRRPVATSAAAAGTEPSLGKKATGTKNARGGPQTRVVRGKRGKAKNIPLKRFLQKQDTKRRTALYVACAAGNTEVADTLLAVGASSEGHGAWQRTPLHIAAYEAHTSAMRSLLGAGADPWAVNGRGQTPSDVSYMYNAHGEVLELLEQAVNMRRVISTGTEGLIGAIFVHDGGQVGSVAKVVEQWSFTLEVELDLWKMGDRSGAKVYLPVRGQRHHTSTRLSSNNLTASMGHSKASRAEPLRICGGKSIPWLAKTIGRMRLESDGLLKVDAGSLVGARANTPFGCGAVISIRDASVRCEVETVTANRAESAEDVTTVASNAICKNPGTAPIFDDGERQRTAVLVKELRAYHHARIAECDTFSPSVEEREPSGSPESLWVDESSRRRDGHGSHDEAGPEAPDLGKRRKGECCEHALPPTVFKHCLDEQSIHVANRKGAPGESGECRRIGSDGWRLSVGDEGDKNGAWDVCSEGTERAAEFDERAVTTVLEQARGDTGSWTAHKGTPAHTRRHTFRDHLVPLAALEGVIDCQTLPPSAMTSLSRARRRRLQAQRNSRLQASPATTARTSSPLASYQTRQQQTAPQCWPTSTMLEVDDLLHLGLDQEKLLGRTREEKDEVEIVGLEEQIEREERSEDRMEKKRVDTEATRSAVVEALALWSSKADLLQARLVVLRTMATAASTVTGTTTSTTANASNGTMSSEEYLASSSPRCCACDKRGGYWQEKSTTPLVPPSDTRPSVAAPASSKTTDDTEGRGINDAGQGITSTCARRNQCHSDGLTNSDSRPDWMGTREEQLIVLLQDCLKHMTHLREWLRLLDQELLPCSI